MKPCERHTPLIPSEMSSFLILYKFFDVEKNYTVQVNNSASWNPDFNPTINRKLNYIQKLYILWQPIGTDSSFQLLQ